MSRGVLAGALVGVVQGLVAVLLVVSLGAGPGDFGWFAYTPLQEGFVVPGPPTVRREWLLVPLVLGGLGALAARFLGRGREPGPGDRRVLRVGVAGLVLAVVVVALAPRAGMPRRYADYVPLESSGVPPAVLLLVGSAAAAAVLVVLAGLAEGRRWGAVGTVVALVLGVAGVVVQLATTGLAAVALLGEVAALVLVAAALVVARRTGQTPPTSP